MPSTTQLSRSLTLKHEANTAVRPSQLESFYSCYQQQFYDEKEVSKKAVMSVINSSGNIKSRVIGQARNVEPVGQIMFDTGSGLNITGAFSPELSPDINDRCRSLPPPRALKVLS